tara:strand:+ start:748 stop:1575 length:828 start_codon:yes stop_codon:yes gene_type:complete
MIQKSPRSRADALERAFRPRYEIYDQPEVYQIAFARSLLSDMNFFEKAWERFGSDEMERVLDIGCGTGQMAIEWARRGYESLGIDLNEKMIEFAIRESRRQGLSASFQVGDMESFRCDSMDAIFCTTGTIHHLTTRRSLNRHFRAISETLRPSGLYFLDVLITRQEDEPVEIDQSWVVGERQWEVQLKLEFIEEGFDLRRRRRWAVLDLLAWDGKEERHYKNSHWFRVFFEDEFKEMVEQHGLEHMAWYGAAPDIRRRIRQPARHPMAYAVLKKV